MDRYRGFGFTMVEDENIELQDKNGQPITARGYYCQIYADYDCNMEIDSFYLTEGDELTEYTLHEAEMVICGRIDYGYEMYSEAKFKALGTSAIYTVIENGNMTYFRTSIAGGFSYPFSIYNAAKSMAHALNEGKPIKNSVIRAVLNMDISPELETPMPSIAPDEIEEIYDEPQENITAESYHMNWRGDYKTACGLMYDGDYENALALFQEEADKGNVPAIYNIAKIYCSRGGISLR